MARVARGENERLIIAYNIKQRRKKKYASNGDCAKAFKVPHSQWSVWESGRRTPDPERLANIAKFFKCSPEDLLTPPENWAEEKEVFLKERNHSSKNRKGDAAPVLNDGSTPPPDNNQDDGTADYISIVTMLAKVQSRFDKGEIPADQFAAKMQSIRDFVSYSYHGLVGQK